MFQHRNRSIPHRPALEQLESRLPPGDALLEEKWCQFLFDIWLSQ